jgi:hypothetical protein
MEYSLAGYATTINFLGFTFLTIMGILTLVLPTRFAILPLILTTCYITIGQIIVVGPLHFSVLRIMILFGWLRIILRRDFPPIGFNAIDKMLIAWVVVGALIYIFLLNDGDVQAMIFQSGAAYDIFGLYFFFRIYIGTFEDVELATRIIAISIVPLALALTVERFTGTNIFSIFGGVPEISWVREGAVRAQGAFRGPINAGTFGATIMPLLISMWWQEENHGKIYAAIGVGAATIITIMANSGGPFSAYAFGVITLLFWRFQDYIKIVIMGLVFMLITLNLVMKAPVWYLLARLSDITGGGGWYRAALIDQAILHFDEWWLYGTNYTAHWMPFVLTIDPRHADITNQYLLEGIRGGVLTMMLFIAVVILNVRGIKNAFMTVEEMPTSRQFLIWCIGATLITHLVTFTSTSYFDQMIVSFYMLLAIVSWASNLPDEMEGMESEMTEQTV